MIYTKWFGPTGTVSEVELIELDATGLECPMPLLKAKRALNAMEAGQQLRLLATDQIVVYLPSNQVTCCSPAMRQAGCKRTCRRKADCQHRG